MTTDRLALEGGAPAVSESLQEGWKQITEVEKKAVLELMDQGILSVGSGGVIGAL